MNASAIIEESGPRNDPIILEEFFEMGQEETVSPFLTPSSRVWGVNLSLKASLLAAALLLISFLLSFTDHQPISKLLLIGVYFLAGIPALIDSLEELLTFEINIDILMTLAAFSSVLIGSGMEGGLLLVLFALSGAMEETVTNKAKSSISSLHRLSPTKALVCEEDGTVIERSIRDITVGTKILIRAGQVVPLDGKVISGISSVNLVHLTGENLPVTKKIDDQVPAGARNLEGTLTIEVSHNSGDSTLARIIQLVTQAQEEKPILQRWFDRLSKAYAITIICLAGLFAISMPYLLDIPFLGVEGSVYRSLAFLIAASPCALIIAIPIAYLSAVGSCARQGILLKGGLTLDALARCKVLAFDKTGTLTTGELKLEAIDSLDQQQSHIREALEIAYAMERNAVHPIAKAIVSYGEENRLSLPPLQDFLSIPGYGLSAIAITPSGPKEAYIGRLEFLSSKIDSESQEKLQTGVKLAQERGELVAVLMIDKKLYILRFSDTLRPHILETIQELSQKKLQLVMLTGDHETSARRIAKLLSITDYRADLHPKDKLEYVSQVATSQGLAMIGDGINDAPALARATVGICMGKVGSTAAIDAADVILLQDNIERLGWLLDKADMTQRIVKQNLILATLAILFASFPALGGFVPLWLAVVMHEGGTVLVGLNGLRLIRD